MVSKNLCFSILISLACSCSSSPKDDQPESEELVKANEFHQTALDLREELIDVEVKLQEAGITYSDLKEELKIWDKDIIEVPGMEHSHLKENHRRYHVHNPPQQFTDDEHLEYQKMMYNEISEIHHKMVSKLSPEDLG